MAAHWREAWDHRVRVGPAWIIDRVHLGVAVAAWGTLYPDYVTTCIKHHKGGGRRSADAKSSEVLTTAMGKARDDWTCKPRPNVRSTGRNTVGIL